MADNEQAARNDSEAGPSSSAGASSPFAELLKEMRQINANISSMRGDLHDIVLEPAGGEVNALDDNSDNSETTSDAATENDHDDTSSVSSMDTKVARLITETAPVATTTSATASDTVLTTIAQELDVNEQMGAKIDERLGSKISDDKWKEKVGKHPRPQNLANLRTLRVNPLIWNQISSGARTNDAKQQKTQHALFGAIIAMTKAADRLVSDGNADAKLITALTDGIALAIQCQHDISQGHRLAMKKTSTLIIKLCAMSRFPLGSFSLVIFLNMPKISRMRLN